MEPFSWTGIEQSGPLHPAEIDSLAARVNLSGLHGKSVLVTGASGMIGNYLVNAIYRVAQAQGFRPLQITGLIRSRPHSLMKWAAQADTVRHLSAVADFELPLPESDIFVHLASPASPSKYRSKNEIWQANLGPAVTALSSKSPPEKFLFSSSGEVYGTGRRGVSEDAELPLWNASGRSTYPNAKLGTEEFLRHFSELSGVEPVIARIFHTFGPGVQKSDGRSFADFLWSASAGRPISMYSDGSQIRPFLYLEDTVAALLLLMTTTPGKGVFNVAGDAAISVRDFADRIARQTESAVHFCSSSDKQGRIESPVDEIRPDVTRLKSLGWRAFVEVDHAIARTLNFIKCEVT